MRIAGEQFEFGLDAVTPRWLPEQISPEFRRAADGIRGLAEDLIDRRRETLGSDDDPRDMLGRLLRAQADPEIEMPDEQIRDEVATFLIAGHETTALSLTYTLSLLAWHPDDRERVRSEAGESLVEDPPTYSDLEGLEFTRRAYLEGLRLYPPAWAVFRRASGDVRLGDYRIEDGSAVVMPQWSIHRDARYFEAPDDFNPDRWEAREAERNNAYFPFASGPHACIGRQFAMSGATLTLARLLRDLEIEVPVDALDDLRVTPTLRPGGGVPASIETV
jgi:cytochrome P450